MRSTSTTQAMRFVSIKRPRGKRPSLTVWIAMLLLLFGAGLSRADDTDIQIDTTMNAYSTTAAHSFSGTMTVGNNPNRYLVIGISLTADTSATGSVMPSVSAATWTVGSTVQNLSPRLAQTGTTGSDDTPRSEILDLVVPTTGNGTIAVTLDTTTISSETADSSPTGATTISSESLGTGDGATTTFSGTLAQTPVVRQTLTITAASVTATDDGSGALSGSGVSSGSINYDTGAWSITYNTAPANGAAITAGYDYGKWKFSGTLAKPAVDSSSLSFSATVGASTKTATDDGAGGLSGDSGNISGTITYSSGAWTLEYMTPPDSGTSITATYDHQNTAQMVGGAVSFYNVHQTTPSSAGAINAGSDGRATSSVSGYLRDAVFGNVATTGPANSLTPGPAGNMTERWKHQNGSGNTDTFGAGATAPNTSDSSTEIRWDLGSSRKWAIAVLNIKPPNAPTLAKFVTLKALDTSRGTLIRWRTGYEVENLGFRIYRESGGERIPLNQRLIAGSALFRGPTKELRSGRSYSFFDQNAPRAGFSTYWLEDVALDGTSSFHGPFVSEPMAPTEEAKFFAEMKAGGILSPSLSDLKSAATTSQGRVSSILRSKVAKLGPWAPAGQAAAKISISQEGYYRVTRAQLSAAGFDPGPDATNLQLFVEGSEVAIRLEGMEDGYFDMGDTLSFYGRGIDTPSTATRIYWLVQGDHPGQRIRTFRDYPRRNVGARIIDRFYPATIEHRDHSIYVAALTDNGNRDNFYGPVIASTPVEFQLDTNRVSNPNAPGDSAHLRVAVQGFSTGEHQVQVEFNGHDLGILSMQDTERCIFELDVDRGWLLEGANELKLTALGGDNDVSVFDEASLTYERPFFALGDELSATARHGAIVRIRGFSNPAIMVLDVSNELKPEILRGRRLGQTGIMIATPPSAGSDNGAVELYTFAENSVRQPDSIVANAPSNWGTSAHQADLVIISAEPFSQAADQLAAHRRSQGLDVEVVKIDDLYDEFTLGEKDPAAIRDFLRYAASSWDKAPRYVLFLGDATFDPRNYLGMGDFDFVPTRIRPVLDLKTADDGWFGDLNDDGKPDLAIGRLPVRTAAEASTVVSKIVGYDSAQDDNGWTQNLSLVAGVGDDFDFETTTDDLEPLVPTGMNSDRINVAQVGGTAAHGAVMNAFDSGRLIINYSGHGSQTIWNSGLLSNDDVSTMTNADRLPVVISMNCLNGFFQDLYQDSLAETLLKAPAGGAVAVWASSALTDPTGQAALNEALYQQIFDGSHPTLGDAMLEAKSQITDPYVRASWIFFGDPSMKLK